MVAADLTVQKMAEQQALKNKQTAETMAEVSKSLVEAGSDEKAILNIISQAAETLVGGSCAIHLLTDEGRRLKPASTPQANSMIAQAFAKSTGQLSPAGGFSLLENVVQSRQPLFIQNLDQEQLLAIISPELVRRFKRLEICGLLIVPVLLHDQAIGSLGLVRSGSSLPFTNENLEMAQNLASQLALALSNARLYHNLEIALDKEKAMQFQLVQAEKHTALSRLMASVAHEINNPVQTIKNCLYLAMSSLEPGFIGNRAGGAAGGQPAGYLPPH